MSDGTRAAETGLLTVLRIVTWAIYVLISAAEIFIAFMFVLQLLGANALQPFVAFIYRWGSAFARPFYGIFPSSALNNAAFINWNALVALAAYAVLAWVVGMALGAVRRQMWRGQASAGPPNVSEPHPPVR